jgi:hypothetical protein
MSNRCYLVGTDERAIYPSFVFAKTFRPENDTYLASAGCIPLAWLLLFSQDDLVTKTLTPEGGAVTVTAPIAEREPALARLAARGPWVSGLFEANGGLAHHFELFTDHVRGGDHHFLTIELEEISGLHPEGEVEARLRRCLAALDARDVAVKDELVWLSTVMIERRFVTLEDAHAGRAERQDQWNYFRIMGEGWSRPAQWD